MYEQGIRFTKREIRAKIENIFGCTDFTIEPLNTTNTQNVVKFDDGRIVFVSYTTPVAHIEDGVVVLDRDPSDGCIYSRTTNDYLRIFSRKYGART